jgi:plastocyanin
VPAPYYTGDNSLGGKMKRLNSTLLSTIIRCMLPLAGLIVPQAVQGATWQATAGAQSVDMGRQALAFLPNELWIHAGDSITWTRAPNETHTVSFLTADQLLPAGPHSNDVITPDGSPFDGSSYVNSGQLKLGQTYTVKFPTAGNFKLVCLVHLYMNGTVHVLEPSARLPHDQAFYDREATDQGSQLLSEIDQRDDKDHRDDKKASRGVIAGTEEIVATGGGFQSVALFRFSLRRQRSMLAKPSSGRISIRRQRLTPSLWALSLRTSVLLSLSSARASV